MKPLESSVSDTTIWSVTYVRSSIMLLESSIMLLESLIMCLENNYSTGITHDDHHMMYVICLWYRSHAVIALALFIINKADLRLLQPVKVLDAFIPK